MSLAYLGLVIFQTAFFAARHGVSPSIIAWAAPLGLLFGAVICCFEQAATGLKGFFSGRLRKTLSGFILFFFYVIGYILLFSLVVSYPLGLVIERLARSAAMATAYGLFSMNVILVVAMASWLDWFRLVVKKPPLFHDIPPAGRNMTGTGNSLTRKKNFI